MRKGKLSPSMMCADLNNIFFYLKEFERANIEMLHIDIMDGEFVPNFALGTDYVKSLRRATNIPFDFHFLVNDPLKKMSWFDIREGDQVAFHYEDNECIPECIEYLNRLGAKSLIAINPETDVSLIEQYLDDADGILMMMIHPGFAGKKMVPGMIEKVEKTRKYLDAIGKDNIFIEVDGNITVDKAEILHKIGADIFVSGSSSIFKKRDNTVDVIKEKRKAIGW